MAMMPMNAKCTSLPTSLFLNKGTRDSDTATLSVAHKPA